MKKPQGFIIKDCHFEVKPTPLNAESLEAIHSLARAVEENAVAIQKLAEALKGADCIGVKL